MFGLHPSGATFDHPLFRATLDGPTLWTGGSYGGGLIGVAIGSAAAIVLLVWAARRGHVRGWRLPWSRRDG